MAHQDGRDRGGGEDGRFRFFRRVAVLVALVGAAATVWLWYWLSIQHEQYLAADFQREVEERVESLADEYRRDRSALKSLGAFFMGAERVEPEGFKQWCDQIVTQQWFGPKLLLWIPGTPDSRAGLSQEMLQGRGDSATGPTEPGWFTGYQCSSDTFDAPAFDFDWSEVPVVAAAMDRARVEGNFVMSDVVDISDGADLSDRVMLIQPVYSTPRGETQVPRAHAPLLGFIATASSPPRLLDRAVLWFGKTDFDLEIVDRQSARYPMPLASYDGSDENDDGWFKIPIFDRDRHMDELRYETKLNLGGRSWIVRASPTRAYLSRRHSNAPLVVLVSGLVFTGLLAMLAYAVLSRNAEVERTVDERTERLEEVNAELEAEITRRRQVERELRESEQQLRVVMDSAPDAIITASSSGRITYVNESAVDMFDRPAAELVGEPLTVLMPERFHEPHRQGLRRYLETGEKHFIGGTTELVGLRGDGTEFPLELALEVWKTAAGEPSFTGIIRDITERKEQQKRLERANAELKEAKKQADAANRAKSEFLASMSHDIRTPMNAVIGFSELLLDTDLDAVQRNYVRLIDQSANSLLRLLNDILDFSKIEAGEFELDVNRFRLCDVLGDSMQTHAVRAFEKGLEIAFRIPPDLPDYLLVGDRLRLRQILDNLVANAVKYTEEGHVYVDVEIEERTDDSLLLHFRVEDTGPGISEGRRDVIFESFRKADVAAARTSEGVGLGLSIASRLVELMGGEIWLETELGEGSTFHFTTEFAVTKAPAYSKARLEQMRGAGVLVVDDVAINRQVLEELFEHWDMEPTVVSGGDEALSVLRKSAADGAPFEVVVLDHLMEPTTGWEVAQSIDDDPDLPDVPIVLLSSAGSDRFEPEQFDELNVVEVLAKPVKQLAIWEATAKAIGAADGRESDRDTDRPVESLEVLVAEDSRVNQTLLRRLMDKRGHRVQIVANGREAVDAFQTGEFDLILMDIEMPEMDGLEATQRIRELERDGGGHIPIVALTAHAMKGDREQSLDAGMDDFISKPVQPDELFQTIQKVLSNASEA